MPWLGLFRRTRENIIMALTQHYTVNLTESQNTPLRFLSSIPSS